MQLMARLVRSAHTFVCCAALIAAPSLLNSGALSLAGLVSSSVPAQARCLANGVMRDDIADDDCLEATKTGCVRNMLTPDQYRNCLAAQKTVPHCIINGKIRDEFSALDCEEAKATGCVRRLLTPAQYSSCLDAQPH